MRQSSHRPSKPSVFYWRLSDFKSNKSEVISFYVPYHFLFLGLVGFEIRQSSYEVEKDTFFMQMISKVIREKSRGEGFLIEQDTIENVSEPNFFFKLFKKKKTYFSVSFYAKNVFTVYNVFRKTILPMKTWENRPQKLPNRPKSSPNLNSCSIKISHCRTSL